MGVIELFQQCLAGRRRRSQESMVEDEKLEQQYRASMRRLREATEDIRRSSGTVLEKIDESEALVREATKR